MRKAYIATLNVNKGGEKRMRKAYIATLVIVACLVCLPSLAQANLLTNYDFETGSESPWVRLGEHVGTVTPGAAYSGAGGLNITMNTTLGDWGGYFQNASANPGEYHTFKAWVDTSNLNEEAFGSLQISYFSELVPSSSAIPLAAHNTTAETGGVAYYERSLTPLYPAPTGTKSVRFVLAEYATPIYGAGNIYYDDAEATLIPEPSSIILMLTGLTGLFGLGFKKRK